MNDELKKLSIAFQESELLEKYYLDLSGVLINRFSNLNINGFYLDLNSLPTEPMNFKEIFIKWMIAVNIERLKAGVDPMFSLDVATRCPIWKVIKLPLRKIKLTKESMFNKPSIKSKSKKTKPGSINKK